MKWLPIKSRKTSRHLRRQPKRTTPRLVCERLEDRCLLAPCSFTVTSSSGELVDGSKTTFLGALAQANASPLAETICFNIAGGGPHTIRLKSLPAGRLSRDTIDGTTQPGYNETPLIELDGSATSVPGPGLVVNSGSTVRGLAINGFRGHGLVIQGYGNVVESNVIGTDASTTLDRGNLGAGVFIDTGASDNTIGTAAGYSVDPTGNSIAFNRGGGVVVRSGTGNRIVDNRIFSNAGLGIDLGGDGVSANDDSSGSHFAWDTDTGPNELQNYPMLDSVVSSGGLTTIRGGLKSRLGPAHTLQFFVSDMCDPSGYGEGERWLTSVQFVPRVRFDGSVDTSFEATAPATLRSGQFVTATATDSDGNTSEFSACSSVNPPGRLEFNAADYRVNESAGTVTVTVRRVAGMGGTVGVTYATANGTARDSSDYTATTGTLTFADGETSKSFTIPINDDGFLEEDETLNLTLSNPTGGATLGPQDRAMLTIADNDRGECDTVVSSTSGEATDGARTTFLGALGRAEAIDTICFNIDDGGPHTIRLAARPTANLRLLTIDATTQPGYSGIPLIELDGSAVQSPGPGLVLNYVTTVRGLAVNGFNGHGIVLEGDSNVIESNYVGVDLTGTLDRGNAQNGILVRGRFNMIGGTTPNARNVISGNGRCGVEVVGTDGVVVENRILGNWIGTTADGSAALGNSVCGVHIENASENTIGGDDGAARNVISGNALHGVWISGSNAKLNTVEGNFIGTNATLSGPVGNGTGVFVQGACYENTIARNMIQSNLGPGVRIADTSGNGADGWNPCVRVENNVVMANGDTGIAIENSSGIVIGPGSCTCSGSHPLSNVIAENLADGVRISGYQSRDNVVVGNKIGTKPSGTEAAGNRGAGVFILDASHNTIEGNVIAGNSLDGVHVSGRNATSNLLAGNLIGTDASGTLDMGNLGAGVFIEDGASNNTVGSEVVVNPGVPAWPFTPLCDPIVGSPASYNPACNSITFNRRGGVVVAAGTGNRIMSNRIFSNTGPGIDLGGDGITAIDPLDADRGGNDLQNYPVLSSVMILGQDVRFQGTFQATPNSDFTVEFYVNIECDESGNGEGKRTLFFQHLLTDAWGNAPIDLFVPRGRELVAPGQFVTLLATDTAGNTSEFSPCVAAEEGGPGRVEFSATALTVNEDAGTSTITVIRTGGTQGSVSVSYATGTGTATAGSDFTATSGTLSFAQGEARKTFTVALMDDRVVEGPESLTVTLSDPTGGATLGTRTSLVLTIADNDTAGISITPTTGLTTTETGGTANFSVVLNSQPTADVTFGISSSNTNEGIVSRPALTFTSANWNVPQQVTVTGVDDSLDDGEVAYSIVTAATSADPNYNGLNPADVSVTNSDNDSAGITITPTAGLVSTEAGGTAGFTVVLNTRPTAEVTIALASSNSAEGTVFPTSLAFTPANWNLPQRATVTGANDTVDDGDAAYMIVTSVTIADTFYSRIDPADVSVTNSDDDTAAVIVTLTSPPVTSETGRAATFTVVLSSTPRADVTIPLASSNPTEGTVSANSLRFTPADALIPHTVTVTGVDDGSFPDGDIVYRIAIGPASSADGLYHGMDPADVSLTNLDNDSPGVLQFDATSYSRGENGGTVTITITRSNGTAGVVSVQFTTSPGSASAGSDYSDASGTVTFGDGQASATVEIPILEDARGEGDETVNLSLADPTRGARLGAQATATLRIIDNDGPTVENVELVPGHQKKITAIVLTFSEPLQAARAGVAGNYRITLAGKDKLLGTADDKAVSATPSYNAKTVRLNLVSPLKVSTAFQITVSAAGVVDEGGDPLDGDGDSSPGGDYTAIIGSSFSYLDSDGDMVSLKLSKGGIMRLERRMGQNGRGDGLDLTILGPVTNKAVLTGNLKPAKGGNSNRCADLRSVTGLGSGFNRLPPCSSMKPGFQVGRVAAAVVDVLLESDKLSAHMSPDQVVNCP